MAGRRSKQRSQKHSSEGKQAMHGGQRAFQAQPALPGWGDEPQEAAAAPLPTAQHGRTDQHQQQRRHAPQFTQQDGKASSEATVAAGGCCGHDHAAEASPGPQSGSAAAAAAPPPHCIPSTVQEHGRGKGRGRREESMQARVVRLASWVEACRCVCQVQRV